MPVRTQYVFESDSAQQYLPAGENISGQKAVHVVSGLVYHTDASDPSHINARVGVSQNAASTGEPVGVIWSGWNEDPSWNWTAGFPVFVGLNGNLTQVKPTAPASLFLKCVGLADTITSIVIDVQTVVVL